MPRPGTLPTAERTPVAAGGPRPSLPIGPGAPRWPLRETHSPARAQPPGPAPAAPGACSSSSRAGAPSLASPWGRQTLRLGAPQISGTVLASRVGAEEAPGVRGGAPGPREDAAVSSCGAPGMRGAQLWERVEAVTWGAPGRAPPPGGRSTCGGRAVGRCFQSRRGFCREPRASPAACSQFGPRPVRGWRVSDWSLHPALLENSGGIFSSLC